MSNLLDRARKLRKQFEEMQVGEENIITDNKVIQAITKAILSPSSINGDDINELAKTVKEWTGTGVYEKGELVNYQGTLYVAIMPIEAKNTATPTKAKTSWQKYIESKEYLDAYGRKIEVDEVTTPEKTTSATDENKPVATDTQSKE